MSTVLHEKKNTFNVTKSNAAARPEQKRLNRREDLDMDYQECHATDRRKIGLYEANLEAFEATTATRTTHSYFLHCLLGEVARRRAIQHRLNVEEKHTFLTCADGTEATASVENMDMVLLNIYQYHNNMLKAHPDRDVYGQSISALAQHRVFNF